MNHPLAFREDDPHLARVREICLALPGAAEKISHGHPNFYTRKVFAIFGGVVKGDHHDDSYAYSMLFLPDAEEREALLADERFFVPGYYGPRGWLGINLRPTKAHPTPDWDEVAELADMSFRNTAPVTLVRQLDSQA